MRIVVDLQSLQNGSRHRGIGRYSLAFTKALIRNKGKHEIFILLNLLFPKSVENIRSEFKGLISQRNIIAWEGVGPVSYLEPLNDWRRKSSEYLREAYIASLEPDVLLVSSMVEGALDDSVTSIGQFNRVFTTVILYDLIPLIYEKEYLADKKARAWYYEKLDHLKKAEYWFSISESSKKEGINYLELPEDRVTNISAAIESDFSEVECNEEIVSRLYGKFGIVKPFLLYSGATDPRKNVNRLIEAYSTTTTQVRESHQLVIAGGMPEGHLVDLNGYARSIGLSAGDVVFTQRVTDEELVSLYRLCKAFIMPSFHEGFGLPALEAMACGAATIGSNVSSIPEVIGLDCALFDPWSVEEMTKKITQVLLDDEFRTKLITHGINQSKLFTWDKTAQDAIQKLELLKKEGEIKNEKPEFDGYKTVSSLITRISELATSPPSDLDLVRCAASISRNILREDTEPTLYVDVSELCRRDSGTGIQRVVRNIALNSLVNGLKKYKVELIYATDTEPYRHAKNFTRRLLGDKSNNNLVVDEVIEPRNGDVFLGLDFQDQIVFSHVKYYDYLRQIGVQVYFVVYDLLPITLSDVFSREVSKNYENWLKVVTAQHGVICISRTVAGELREWTSKNKNKIQLSIGWFHLGSDLVNNVSSKGLTGEAKKNLNLIKENSSFLVVSTIEPRKKHAQILSAFEQLWLKGVDINLVIVGKQGWQVDKLVEKLRHHAELGKRLFWLEGISDEYLEQVYAASTCLIAASEGEGFGLPLIEAAQHNTPIIARDIPVFREVADKHAYYFKGFEPELLTEAIERWLDLNDKDKAPSSNEMPWLTWEQSTEQLLKNLPLSVA